MNHLLGEIGRFSYDQWMWIREIMLQIVKTNKKVELGMNREECDMPLLGGGGYKAKYQLAIIKLYMEDTPAGQSTLSNSSFVSSPKKVYNPIGTESQWSLGWQGGARDVVNRPTSAKSTFNAYHNQSNIVFGEGRNDWKREEAKNDFKKKRDPVEDRPVWNYNPKNAGKTTMVLGDEKPDYRKKDEFYKQRTPTTLTNSRRK